MIASSFAIHPPLPGSQAVGSQAVGPASQRVVSSRAARCGRAWGDAVLWLAIAGCWLAAGAPRSGWAADDAVQRGREAMRKSDLPWYDAGEDQERAVTVRQSGEFTSHRDTAWESRPKKSSNTNWFRPGNWNFGGVFEFFRVMAWVLLAVVLLGVVSALIWFYLRGERRDAAAARPVAVGRRPGDAARVENLPFEIKVAQTDLLASARNFYQNGDLKSAIIYFYSYLLVELDKHQLIHLEKGKTNRQYVRELRRREARRQRLRDQQSRDAGRTSGVAPGAGGAAAAGGAGVTAGETVRSVVETTMVAFEDVFFGDHRLERQQFEACWDRLGEFQQAVQQAAS